MQIPQSNDARSEQKKRGHGRGGVEEGASERKRKQGRYDRGSRVERRERNITIIMIIGRRRDSKGQEQDRTRTRAKTTRKKASVTAKKGNCEQLMFFPLYFGNHLCVGCSFPPSTHTPRTLSGSFGLLVLIVSLVSGLTTEGKVQEPIEKRGNYFGDWTLVRKETIDGGVSLSKSQVLGVASGPVSKKKRNQTTQKASQ